MVATTSQANDSVYLIGFLAGELALRRIHPLEGRPVDGLLVVVAAAVLAECIPSWGMAARCRRLSATGSGSKGVHI